MSHAPQPGTILGEKYRVEQVLGVGGMGVVVAATHLQLEQRVALKFLLPEALKNPELVGRFAREARAAAKIRGEHVARVIDVSQFFDGTPYMVMEYLEGHDLDAELRERGPLPVQDTCRYMLETCEALAEAHVKRIVHRDLKPANLFLARQPGGRAIIKVLDFGISKLDDAQSAGITKTSGLMGTAFYMSPEQLTTPKAVDARSDIWALGIIMFELFTGAPPFKGELVPEVIAAIIQNQRASLAALRPDLPRALVDVVDRCLSVKPEHRFANVAELSEALAPFVPAADRRSVEVARQVLSVAPESSPELSAPSPSVVRPEGTPNATVSASDVTLASDAFAASGANPALTAQGLAASVPHASGGEAARRARLPLVFGAVGLAAALAVAIAVVARPGTTSPASATSASAVTAEAPLPATASASASVEVPAPVASEMASAEPAGAAPAGVTPAPAPPPRTTAKPASTAPAKRQESPPSKPSQKSNPLEMGIK